MSDARGRSCGGGGGTPSPCAERVPLTRRTSLREVRARVGSALVGSSSNPPATAKSGSPQALLGGFERWRWRWDLNPRRSCPLTRFRGVLLRPLGHATVDKPNGRETVPRTA